MNATVDHQYMQFYQQPHIDGMALVPSMEEFWDATLVTTSPTMSSEGISSPSNSYNSSGHLTPKSNAFKPIRRRSRASKRTPITLLNANTNNFRALVQQFTGCPTTTMSFPIHKGPITLNFQQGSKQQIRHHTTRAIPPFGTTSSNQVHQVAVPLPWQNQAEQVPKQQFMQEQQSGFLFDHVKSTNFLPSNSDGLLMNNDFSLHELAVNAFSDDNEGLFM